MLHALPRIEPPPGGTVLGTTDRNGPCKTSDCPRTAGKRPLALAANLRVVQGGFGCAGPVIGEASLGPPEWRRDKGDHSSATTISLARRRPRGCQQGGSHSAGSVAGVAELERRTLSLNQEDFRRRQDSL